MSFSNISMALLIFFYWSALNMTLCLTHVQKNTHKMVNLNKLSHFIPYITGIVHSRYIRVQNLDFMSFSNNVYVCTCFSYLSALNMKLYFQKTTQKMATLNIVSTFYVNYWFQFFITSGI